MSSARSPCSTRGTPGCTCSSSSARRSVTNGTRPRFRRSSTPSPWTSRRSSPTGDQMAEEPHPTLAWPAHDIGPTPPPDTVAAARGERSTRKKLPFWDRVKFVLLLVLVFFLFVWADMANIPILPFKDAFRRQLDSKWWLIGLFVLEVLRQIHYLISEHWSGYHRFWTDKIFGGLERRTHKLNDWNRFRIARIFKYTLLAVILIALLGASQHEAAVLALFHLP